MGKPNVLILGGCGFIGRNLVEYLVKNDCAGHIRVVDKVLPQTAFLGKAHQDAFAKVEFKQGNLCSAASIAKCFECPEGKYNYVFNLAAETKYGQSDEVYNEKVLDVAKKCAEEAKKVGVDKFIEVSTGQLYSGDKKASNEESKLSAWTNLAKYKQKAEEYLTSMDGLPLVIVRPAVVYGPGDTSGLSPRLIVGAVYKHIGEKLEFLWTEKLKLNTVHVRDVCKALFHLAEKADAGTIYNLADKSDSTQDSIGKLISEIFGVKVTFAGSIKSNLAKVNLKGVTEMVNDKHLKPWSDLCKQHNILNTPLTPYLDQELLYNNALSMDGTKIESTGFAYDHPNVTVDLVKESIAYFQEQNLFPPL